MILGTGIDMVEVARIAKSYAEFGDRFADRVLRPAEKAYCLANQDPLPFLAARFAAKEAIAKAFGTGIGPELSWLDMEICHHESGAPHVVLHGRGKELFTARGARALHISLTHTAQYGAATAILEG